MKKSSLLLVAFGLVAAACGGDPMMSDDAGPGLPDAMMTDGGPMTGRDGGPNNDTFGGAREVTVDGTAVMDAIERPNDVDFWRFEGTAGQWVVISTTANADDDPMMVDTVLTLYDSTRTQIAENDDGVPRTSTDSEIVIQLPMTGTYYIEVQEFSTWDTMAGLPAEGMPTFRYELAVLPLMAGGAFNVDAEGGDDLASAQALVFGGMASNIAFVLGDFDDATDVDAYSFTVSAAGSQLSTDVMPAGVDGYGSTRAAARLWISDETGATVMARIQPRDAMQSELSPPLAPGNYVLWVDAGGGTAGSNDHYVLKSQLIAADNPPEAEMAAGENDTTATAEALTPEDDAGVLRAFILARLSTATDVDTFSFTVPAGRELNAFCGSASLGSGVQGLRVELLEADGTTVAGMATEGSDGAAVRDIAVATEATYYLRLSKTGQAADNTGDYIRCGIALVTPMAP